MCCCVSLAWLCFWMNECVHAWIFMCGNVYMRICFFIGCGNMYFFMCLYVLLYLPVLYVCVFACVHVWGLCLDYESCSWVYLQVHIFIYVYVYLSFLGDRHMFMRVCFTIMNRAVSWFFAACTSAGVVEQQQWLSDFLAMCLKTHFTTQLVWEKTNSAVSGAPAAVIDNFTPLRVCRGSRRRLSASGSTRRLSRPQHITDSFCP